MYKAQFTKALTVSMSDATYQHIKAISDKKDSSMGSLVRKILEEHLLLHSCNGVKEIEKGGSQ
ncbi:MAG: hypothetical protein WCQ90_13715 [Deltaproteobacteria bacterium]